MVKSVIEDETVGLSLLEEMEAGGHVVSLAPVDFPLPEDGETGLNLETDIFFVSES